MGPDGTIDRLHGVPVPDPHRWLEDGDAPAVQAWVAEQNARTAAWLEAVPERHAVRARLAELLAIGVLGTPVPAGTRCFYQRREGMQDQPVLVVREADGRERVLLDPAALSVGGPVALDWFHPSTDGSRVAVGLSRDGSERSTLRVLDVDAGTWLADEIPHARAASLAWWPDGRGFHYTRHPAPGTVPPGEEHYGRAVYAHRLGDDPAADPLVFRPAEREHWPSVALAEDGRWLTIAVARGFDRGDLWLLDLHGGGPPVPVAVGGDARVEGFVAHGVLHVRSEAGAPRGRLLALDPARPDLARARVLVPEDPRRVLRRVAVTARGLVVEWLERAASVLEVRNLDGTGPRPLALPGLGTVGGLGASPRHDACYIAFSSYTLPPRVLRCEPPGTATTTWAAVRADVDLSAFEVRLVEYPSADGTAVSMCLVHHRDLVRDGSHAAYLTGYGGFGISQTPAFARSLVFWLERGGIVAVPHLRGGGEHGEAWHRAGMLESKQRTFDDFIAAAEWLVAQRYTRPARLAIAGGSNGGLLVGAALTQRPDLFRAVVCSVPLLDMLRYHRFLVARLWIPEYGSADDPAQFPWLHAYSPYHRVRDGTAYPAVLLLTAESDSRVDPLHARKMAARLQAATASGHPVLLRQEPRAGHGAGKPLSKLLEELVASWVFVCRETGDEAPGGGATA